MIKTNLPVLLIRNMVLFPNSEVRIEIDSELDKNISNKTDGEKGPSNVNPSYQANWPVMMNEVLVVEYYFEEIDGEQVEVVECQIVQFLHVYNTTYVARYQGLNNVKNRSFTRYEIYCMSGNLDFRNANPPTVELANELFLKFKEAVKYADGVVISDQFYERNTGVVSDYVRDGLNELAKEYDIPFLVDF